MSAFIGGDDHLTSAYDSVDDFKILSSEQHGFVPKHSTTNARTLFDCGKRIDQCDHVRAASLRAKPQPKIKTKENG